MLDRRSFLRFLDLIESSSIPDAKTIWLFRDRLAQARVRRQPSIRAGPATNAVAGLPGVLRPDRRCLAGAGPGPAQQTRRSRDRPGRIAESVKQVRAGALATLASVIGASGLLSQLADYSV